MDSYILYLISSLRDYKVILQDYFNNFGSKAKNMQELHTTVNLHMKYAGDLGDEIRQLRRFIEVNYDTSNKGNAATFMSRETAVTVNKC